MSTNVHSDSVSEGEGVPPPQHQTTTIPNPRGGQGSSEPVGMDEQSGQVVERSEHRNVHGPAPDNSTFVSAATEVEEGNVAVPTFGHAQRRFSTGSFSGVIRNDITDNPAAQLIEREAHRQMRAETRAS
jgi:hypothetical protein